MYIEQQVFPRLKRVGWVVDIQNDFINPDGRLYVKNRNDPEDPGVEIIRDRIVSLSDYLLHNTQLVIYTADWHAKDHPSFSDNPNYITTFPPHCVGKSRLPEDHNGALPIPEIMNQTIFKGLRDNATPQEAKKLARGFKQAAALRNPHSPFVSPLIQKDSADVFRGNQVADTFIKELLDPDAEIYIMGVTRDVSVNYAVAKLIAFGYNVIAMPQGMYGVGIEEEITTYRKWSALGVRIYLKGDATYEDQ